jgi:hypothetical protein
MTQSKHCYTAGGRSLQHETPDALRVVAKNLTTLANQMTDSSSKERMLGLAARYHQQALLLEPANGHDVLAARNA